ncbi:phosphatidylserine decarboxylase-related protein [Azorhizobium caulinodans ORS 571]|uniref:Phosphatidylserine decarboxylase proenzyme n=1 Tax=Azorhizobium caulinodans (strain ATCC 43989 / DSM 5975 / JCM 20966 / LMG 6465 / NBRC 14845 / NCIMB 13405 / ORS 571) TaxID=438753 RepID=PSD_AZOC5|nr:phosphatidylserine decarboxylase [Azorhizobium caulinodans]A8HXJ6.1 RecName: Full=Phosphatidylserine decarboxylase proenzyme; Contains: RecName: Full=Phosphatidylserine decarboxylase alpha chain; Contains: RecName: Full=Phosphatidylserine decarboxylase beta chain [Azorhizobium caulinodans ORS 571]BAF87507.1 phosphatidylserine decarboxylase-related protein [Azorhizobium caulinodans ORS 571]
MSVLTSIRKSLVPIHREGYPFIAIAVVIAIGLLSVSTFFGMLAVGLAIWTALFFRDPQRVTPLREGLVVAPADGRISQIGLALPPRELGLSEVPLLRISIFMNVFNVHVNRAPVTGRIEKIAYKPGLFLNAELDKASEDNERNGLIIHGPNGVVGVVQIAGLIARRIVSFVHEGETIGAGERFGLIRFGSRVDVYLPVGTRVLVSEGQLTVAGETILADYDAAPTRDIAFRVS